MERRYADPGAQKSTHRDFTINALGFTIKSDTMRISLTRKKTEAIKRLLVNHWPTIRWDAIGRDVLSMARKLWDTTYVARAGTYFMWRLFRRAT